MRYISDDGKVFNTEYECCEYENNLKKKRLAIPLALADG